MKLRNVFEIGILIGAASLGGCTGQIPGSFRLAQQEEAFDSQLQINTQIDLLWVVDNSSSMDVSQEKLRNGFKSFAQKYMQPTWDIRVAVITTDTYLANPGFSDYLDKVIPGTPAPWVSAYMASKTKAVSNPLYDTVSHTFPSGLRYRDLVPVWGSDYAKLIPGIHDGPMPALCSEVTPYFLKGVTNCKIRDDLSPNSGPSHCLAPTGSESSLSECVNTIENNTVHSGKAIIKTMPPSSVTTPAQLAAWTDELVNDFMVNVTTGTTGFGSERGLGSVLELLDQNEGSAYAFFRPGSLRGIIFVTDEEDQTMEIPSTPPADFSPWSYFKCDQASLLAMNPTKTAQITGVNGYCCSTPGNNCRYGSEGTSCGSKTVGGLTYSVSICPREDKLIPVTTVKSRIDQFFRTLDGVDSSVGPNYFVVSIVPTTGAAISSLQAARDADDVAVGVGLKTFAVDRGDRYIAFGNAVGNGSMSMDISSSDYSPILDAIGTAIIMKKGVFTLQRVPTAEEDMLVWIEHQDGSRDTLPSSKYAISGKDLMITDMAVILGFASTDKIIISYQPKTLY